ncbi:hypothetical protein H4S07_002548 [Coemansia furcata]|uniref:Uncharacterized protein n=1 Tax=Coemansia furcata TaxID=417177 RepID=A0ACC1LLC1_9FUNG|nr:hypothetical protein H4S07_002548 [Coemansia furcata]
MVSFSPNAAQDSTTAAALGESRPKLSRRASLLTRNRAFDGYKITDRSGGKRSSRRTYMLPDITLRRVFFIGLWICIQTVVLVYKWVTEGQKAKSAFTGFSLAAISCMMVSYAAIFLFMSPTLLELLRRTFISRYVVIEKNVHAHKVAAYTFLFWMVAHIAAYYYIFEGVAAKSKGHVTFSYMLFQTMVGKTGHAMLFLFFALCVASVPVVRRRFHEVFYLMHHMFIPTTILLFIHGSAKSFPYYIAGPGAIYIIDRVYRLVRSRFRHPRILSVIQHPSNVIELKMEKRGMKFQVGQYAYINVPSISLLEWHPFTLTSAPEEDELSMHIWIAGGWTRKLVLALQGCAVSTVSSLQQQPPYDPVKLGGESKEPMYRSSSVSKQSTGELSGGSMKTDLPMPGGTLRALADQELLMHHLRGEIDPVSGLPKPGVESQYNSLRSSRDSHRPWSRVGRNSVVLLDRLPPEIDYRMSGSYAVPPAAKISDLQPAIKLPKIMIDGPYGAPTQQVFDYEHVVLIAGGIGVTPMSSVLKSLYYQLTNAAHERRIVKVYFLWVCRDIQALEWFQDLLVALDEEDIGDVLEIRTYLTGQLTIDQIRNIALYQDPDGPDAVTGLYRSPTYYGRPNFNNILENIGLNTPGSDIGVFFCGPKPMGRTVRKISRKWTKNLAYANTKFVFHKENF